MPEKHKPIFRLCDICGNIYDSDYLNKIVIEKNWSIYVCRNCRERDREAVEKYVKKARKIGDR
jgi:ribosome-binding protein aMBF1 (putative translation factor)